MFVRSAISGQRPSAKLGVTSGQKAASLDLSPRVTGGLQKISSQLWFLECDHGDNIV